MVNLPKWLERTEAEVAEENKIQELRRASFGRAHKTREEELVGRGAALEETARGNLAAGDTEVSLSQLAEGLAMQGRYAEAAQHAPNAEIKATFDSIVAAIDMPDEERCECSDYTGNVDGVDITITPRFAARQIFSAKHNRVVSLITCNKCGHVNAREPRSRLLLSEANHNLAAAEGRGRGMIRDSQILKNA